MSFPAVLQASQMLNASVEALAALGAHLRSRREGLALDPAVASLLDEVATAVHPGVADLTEGEADIILAFARSFFRQANDLLDHPDRPPGWTSDDPVVLQAQGQASRLIVQTLRGYAGQDAAFSARLDGPSSMLDVGTGVGWFAIEAARTWPKMRIDGIDIHDVALELARANVDAAEFADRVSLRRQSIDSLALNDTYDFVWFSGPFVDPAIVPESLRRIHAALKPGGYLVFGIYNPPPAPLGRALAALRTVRSGGRPWTREEADLLLESAGFVGRSSYTTGSPILIVTGRKT